MKLSYLIILVLMAFAPAALLTQTITPAQTDEIIIDNGTMGNADPGDKIRYKVTITNSGTTEGTGVQLNVTPDMLTTLVPGSFRSSPVAVDDSYAGTGNVGISVPAASGVKANDFDDALASATLSCGTCTTANGGTVALMNDGSFTYTPVVGFTGSDNFTYTITDGNPVGAPIPTTDMATVTITVSNLIWFVDNTGGGSGGTGTLSNPFKTLADFNGSMLPTTGHVVFIKNTGTNYPGGIVLKNNQYLFGTGHAGGTNLADVGVLPFTIASHSQNLPAIGGTRPVLTNVSGVGIRLASGNTVRGLNAGTCSGFGIDDNGNIGTLNIAEVSINNTSGGGLRTANGGTINFTGNGNTIAATTNTAVNIANTTIGGSGVTLQSISMDASNSANTAIILENTGSGSFTVTGVGATAGSGGTIENIRGADGITLKNTDGLVTLKNMIIEDISAATDGSDNFHTRSGIDGIHGENVDAGLTLDNVTMRRFSDNAINGATFGGPFPGLGKTNWNGLQILNSVIEDANRYHVDDVGDDSDEGLLRIVGLTGIVLIDNSTLQRGAELMDFMVFPGVDGTGADVNTLNMTVQRSIIRDSYKEFTTPCCGASIANVGKMGIDVTVEDAANAVVTIGHLTNTALGNDFDECASASIRIAGDAGTTPNSGNIDATVANNNFTITNHTSTLGTSFNFPQGGVSLTARGTTTHTFDAIVKNNIFTEVMHAAGGLGQLTMSFDDGASQLRIEGNTFDRPWDEPVKITADGNASAAVLSQNNTFLGGCVTSPDLAGFPCPQCPGVNSCLSPYGPYEIVVRNSGNLDFTMLGENLNPIDLVNNPFNNDIEVQLQTSGGTLCLNLMDNDSPDGFGLSASGGTFNVFKGSSTTTCTSCTNAQVQGVLNANGNTGGGGISMAMPPTVSTSGTINVISSACAVPMGGIFAWVPPTDETKFINDVLVSLSED